MVRSSWFISRALLVGTVTTLLLADPARAQEFDGRTTEGTIDRVSNTLVGIAIGIGVMLVIYIWHTNPHRRVRVATRRRDRKEQLLQAELEDEFVLPTEVDDHPAE